jgi:hypothetical protein
MYLHYPLTERTPDHCQNICVPVHLAGAVTQVLLTVTLADDRSAAGVTLTIADQAGEPLHVEHLQISADGRVILPEPPELPDPWIAALRTQLGRDRPAD